MRVGVGGRAPGEGEHVVDGPLVEGAHRDDLLGEHVERGRRARAAPRSAPASMRSTTTAVCTRSPRNFGKSTPAADGADLVPGAADALQPGGDRRRRLDLHDEVDGAHVDAELEAARGDDGRAAGRT